MNSEVGWFILILVLAAPLFLSCQKIFLIKDRKQCVICMVSIFAQVISSFTWYYFVVIKVGATFFSDSLWLSTSLIKAFTTVILGFTSFVIFFNVIERTKSFLIWVFVALQFTADLNSVFSLESNNIKMLMKFIFLNLHKNI